MPRFFRTLVVGEEATNCYIFARGVECIVIDPGAPDPRIASAVRDLCPSLVTLRILLTHSHWDHCLGVDFLISEFPGTFAFISDGNRPGLFDPAVNLSAALPERFALQSRAFVKSVRHGDTIACGPLVVDVLETPGHTPGSLTYVVRSEKAVFSGDTLFRGSIGFDCPEGMVETLKESIRSQILMLPGDFQVFLGHFGATTVADEA
jgi:glyoxylase-like metal-dependent hydrolase (beta-lactamase superfamily II)